MFKFVLEELLQSTDEPPAIRLVNVVILEAVRLGASDIHIHPRTKSVVVRYRIDGVLVDKIHIPHNLHMALVSRIKVMSELDITERRRPQDGRITVKTALRIIDLRISTLPTINGENSRVIASAIPTITFDSAPNALSVSMPCIADITPTEKHNSATIGVA